MPTEKKLQEAIAATQKVAHKIREMIPQTADYDLARLLKKVDADLADALHDLAIAARLAEKKTA